MAFCEKALSPSSWEGSLTFIEAGHLCSTTHRLEIFETVKSGSVLSIVNEPDLWQQLNLASRPVQSSATGLLDADCCRCGPSMRKEGERPVT